MHGSKKSKLVKSALRNIVKEKTYFRCITNLLFYQDCDFASRFLLSLYTDDWYSEDEDDDDDDVAGTL